MTQHEHHFRHGVEQRLEFIEFRLFWEGHVNRRDLIERFGISVNQASADISKYMGLAEANIEYDKSGRTYVRGKSFEPVFLRPNANQYLNQIRSIYDGIISPRDSWISELPDFAIAPNPSRTINVGVLRAMLESIDEKCALEILYQSLSQAGPAWRRIAPHAIGFDGYRWHARAWCAKDEIFKDFVLSRIRQIRRKTPIEISAADDEDWNTDVSLFIAPHPDLSETQKQVICEDYSMQKGVAQIIVRKALLYYTLKRLGLDTDPSARKPQDQQIILVRQEVMQ